MHERDAKYYLKNAIIGVMQKCSFRAHVNITLTTGLCICPVLLWTCHRAGIQVYTYIRPHVRESARDQTNPEHRQAKGRQHPDSYGPTSRPFTPAPVFAAGGKPSTRLPPGELVEHLGSTESAELTKDSTHTIGGDMRKYIQFTTSSKLST